MTVVATLTSLSEVITGGETTITLHPPTYSIGRGLQNDFVIQDINVSRQHCCFEQTSDSWFVSDKSSNGTVINNNLIDPNKKHKLSNGDIIQLGINIKLRYNEEQSTLPPIQQDIENSRTDSIEKDKQQGKKTKMKQTNETVEDQPPEKQAKCTTTNKIEPSTSSSNSNVDNLEVVEDELQCSICTEMFVKAVTLNCSHTFCSYCIAEWRKGKSFCPICRNQISSVTPTLVLDSFISKVLETASEEARKQRTELIAEREAANKVNVPETRTTRSTRSRQASTIPVVSISEDDESDSLDDFDDMIGGRRGSDVSTEFSDINDWDEEYDDYDMEYNGIPGQYYGGYGRCYSCGDQGHWANGCPYRH